MIETKIKLIECKWLLCLSGSLASMILIGLFVINFETCKHGIFEADVYTDQIKTDRVRFVCFKWWRYGETCLCISIQYVNELLFFDCAYHERTSLGIGGQKLTRHNTTTAGFSECFLMNLLAKINLKFSFLIEKKNFEKKVSHFFENIFWRIIFKDDHATRIRAHNYIVCLWSERQNNKVNNYRFFYFLKRQSKTKKTIYFQMKI